MRARSRVAIVFLALSMYYSAMQLTLVNGRSQMTIPAEPQNGFPFQVGLVLHGFPPNHPEKAVDCGGAWISPQWVLTAAHCLTNSKGLFVLSNAETNQTLSEAIAFCIPKEFVSGNGLAVNDIGLIEVANPDATRITVATPASEDEESIPAQGADALIGVRTDNEAPPFIAHKVRVMSEAACKQVSKFVGFNNDMLCAGDPSPCPRDSGGPLVEMVGDRPELVGIISSGGSCATGQPLPTVFTRVSHFATWIKPIINGQKDDSCRELDVSGTPNSN